MKKTLKLFIILLIISTMLLNVNSVFASEENEDYNIEQDLLIENEGEESNTGHYTENPPTEVVTENNNEYIENENNEVELQEIEKIICSVCRENNLNEFNRCPNCDYCKRCTLRLDEFRRCIECDTCSCNSFLGEFDTCLYLELESEEFEEEPDTTHRHYFNRRMDPINELPELTGNERWDIVAVATSQIGVNGNGYFNSIFSRELGVGFNDWCGDFVAWVFKNSGLERYILHNSRSNRTGCGKEGWNFRWARAWARDSDYFSHVEEPLPGDIIVWIGHVAIITEVTETHIVYVGGNQCGNRVTERRISRNNTQHRGHRLLAFVRVDSIENYFELKEYEKDVNIDIELYQEVGILTIDSTNVQRFLELSIESIEKKNYNNQETSFFDVNFSLVLIQNNIGGNNYG